MIEQVGEQGGSDMKLYSTRSRPDEPIELAPGGSIEFEVLSADEPAWTAGEKPTTWRAGVDLSGYQVAPNEEVARWLDRIAINLDAGQFSIESTTSANGKQAQILYVPDAIEESFFTLTYDKQGETFSAEVCGTGPKSDKPRSAERWKKAIHDAYEDVYEGETDSWDATIEIFEYSDHSGGPEKLITPGQIGPFRLSPAESPVEYEFTYSRSRSTRIKQTWPIEVHGHGPINEHGTPIASAELRRLCLVLSIATGRRWTIRREATATSVQQQDNLRTSANPQDEEDLEFDFGEFELEPWMTDAYELLERDPRFASSAGVFYEGLAIGLEHPSVALVCFVSSIEALGELEEEDLNECEHCKSKLGATKRFEQQINKLAPIHNVKKLKNLYGKRSRTVHASELHGREASVGLMSETFNPYIQNNAFFTEVWALQAAARELLQLTALGSSYSEEESEG